MAKNDEMLLIGAVALFAGAFLFKDQICQAVPGIPLLCNAGGGLMARDTPNCNAATHQCVCPGGTVFQMGASRTCEDCSAECAKRANYAGYY